MFHFLVNTHPTMSKKLDGLRKRRRTETETGKQRFAAIDRHKAGEQDGCTSLRLGDILLHKASIGPVDTPTRTGRKSSGALLLFSVLSLAFGLVVLPALAGSSSTTFQASMTVPRSCKVTISGSFNFGNYDPVVANASAPLNVTVPAFLSVYCTKGTPSVWVGLNTGTNSSHAPAGMNHAASDGKGNYVGYEFYQDPAFTTVWGNTQATAPTFGPFNSAKTPATAHVYGRAPAGQDLPAGTYTDTITATVNF
jgi:spore coat protein U-like protein